MCVSPTQLDPETLVACRYCWQCRENRLNDLVGRCIAEQYSSDQTLAVALTYAGDGPETAMLRYADVQKMLKRLRRAGFYVRYIVAGEYGSKKGRAHWHGVLFFSAVHPEKIGPFRVPKIVDDHRKRGPWDVFLPRWANDDKARIAWRPWKHGFAYFQQPNYGGFAYCLKYALKDQSEVSQVVNLAMSKKPALGHHYFMKLAQQHVDQGLAPSSLLYSFDVFDAKGKRRKFLIKGISRENYLQAFEDLWSETHGTPSPITEVMADKWDKEAREWINSTRSDEWHMKDKNQWPKYSAPGEGFLTPPDGRWDFVATSWPASLSHVVPAHLGRVLDGEPLTFTVEAWENLKRGDKAHEAPQISYRVTLEDGEGWLGLETDVEDVTAWAETMTSTSSKSSMEVPYQNPW